MATWDRDASAVRSAAALDSGLPPLDTARHLRAYVHEANIVGSGEFYGADGRKLFFNLGRAGSEQQCGGMSWALAWALNTLGIPARVVQLAGERYIRGEDAMQTHVTVEALIDGQWRIEDPTFDTEFGCSDGQTALSVTDARQCLSIGGVVVGASSDEFATYLAAYLRFPVVSLGAIAGMESGPRDGWLDDAAALY